MAMEVRSECGGHDKNQEKEHRYEINRIPTECLGERAREERSGAETDKEKTCKRSL